MHKGLRFLAVAVAATCSSAVFAQYWNVGANVTPYAVNDSGRVAGYQYGAEYFMWNPGGAIQYIGGQVPGDGHGGTPSISADGGRIGGTAMNTVTGKSEMAYYDVETAQWNLCGSLGSYSDAGASAGFGISGDGSTVVGNGWINAGNAHVAVWKNGVMTTYGSSVPNRSTRANGVNFDGTVVGGYQDREDGYRSGAVWVNGVQTLMVNANNDPLGDIFAVSSNGEWAVGAGQWYGDGKAYMWNRASNSITYLDNPWVNDGREMMATGVSGDGSVVVGIARGWWMTDMGWIWTAGTGVMTMEAYCTLKGIDYQGSILSNPLGISADGSYIVGDGYDSTGWNYQGWAIHANPVPEPGTMIALGAGIAGLIARRRKKA